MEAEIDAMTEERDFGGLVPTSVLREGIDETQRLAMNEAFRRISSAKRWYRDRQDPSLVRLYALSADEVE